jgi:hypothetical protein
MRTPPEHDRATLLADSAALQDCAARLEALTASLPADSGPDWDGILAVLAGHCRVAAAELERAAAHFAEGAEGAPARREAALALGLAGRLLRAPAAAGPGLLIRRRTDC